MVHQPRAPFTNDGQLHALSEYIGAERVDDALRRLFEKHRSGTPPLPTTLDLSRELQAVTPDSLQSLLHDLFAANTFWELETERATAEQTAAGAWQVTLDVQARKMVVDEAGVKIQDHGLVFVSFRHDRLQLCSNRIVPGCISSRYSPCCVNTISKGQGCPAA